MTIPIRYSAHTVPALQEMAGNVRTKAREVQAEATELHRAADEIDAIISRLQAERRPAGALPPTAETAESDVDGSQGGEGEER